MCRARFARLAGNWKESPDGAVELLLELGKPKYYISHLGKSFDKGA